ncbi:MAG: Lrp/AsnC family transcriptional regulator [Paraglaciecola sp.]|uniref:Lrp/AsnC family transcriptional regulator n=1 Tax=Paraglaciecola TaxID=1621534 RepID=UPI001060DD01|nr:Lrp/AsnC family transcriptional regulator [Paraglaciecola marina]
MKFDKYDRLILEIIQQQGRISNQELAEAINLSPSPCLRRVKQLEEAGFIDGYVALLDAKKLGLSLVSFMQVSMDKHTPERFNHFEAEIAKCSEVLECHLVTGQTADYLLKVIIKDMDGFQHFLLNKLTPIDGVSGVQSSFVLKSPINTRALPIL